MSEDRFSTQQPADKDAYTDFSRHELRRLSAAQ